MTSNGDSDGLVLFACGYCGESNETLIDDSIGKKYEVIEDCSVCCKPNVVHLVKEDGEWTCWATPENE